MRSAERRATPPTGAEREFDEAFMAYVRGDGALEPVVAAAKQAFGADAARVSIGVGALPAEAVARIETLRAALARVGAGPG